MRHCAWKQHLISMFANLRVGDGRGSTAEGDASACQGEDPKPKWIEDELYEQWLHADNDAVKEKVKGRLFEAVYSHIDAIISLRFKKSDPDLRSMIMLEVLRNFHTFEGRSAFSTWVQSIIEKQINLELRRRYKYAASVKEVLAIGEEPGEHNPSTEWDPETRTLLNEFREGLTPRKAEFLDAVAEGKDHNELAEQFSASRAAAESERRRIRSKLKKII